MVLSELLCKSILQIQYRFVGHREEAVSITHGKKFVRYQPRPIDEIFLSPFIKNPELILPFKQVLQIAINEASSKGRLFRLVLKSINLNNILKYEFLYSLLGKVKLTKYGKVISKRIKDEINFVNEDLSKLTRQNDLDHSKILDLLKFKFFYLQNYNVAQIFGANYAVYLEEYNSTGYDIQHELNFLYFKEKLKHAHIELLKIEHMKEKFEEQEDDWGNWEDDWD